LDLVHLVLEAQLARVLHGGHRVEDEDLQLLQQHGARIDQLVVEVGLLPLFAVPQLPLGVVVGVDVPVAERRSVYTLLFFDEEER
jgi:hypothetical protein